jgi:hypothetical protein
MAMSPNEFRDRAAEHAEAALSVAAEIVGNEELSPTVRLEAGKWITKVADLEPKLNPQGGRGEPFSIVINMGDGVSREQKLVLQGTAANVAEVSMLDRLLGEE